VAVTAFWGSTFLIIQLAMQHSGPLFFVGLRFVTAGLVGTLVFWKRLQGLTRQDLVAGMVIGVSICLGYVLQTWGLKTIPVSQSAFITGLYVPMVPLLQWLVMRRRPSAMNLVGVTLAFAGLVLMAGPQEGEVGMSSVFPTATARAEAEQATEAFVPAATQAVAQSAPSSSSAFPSQSSAPQWGSAPSSDAAAGQAPSFSDMVPTAAGSPFDRPAGGGALAAARSEEVETADSVGSWMLTLFLMAIPVVNLVWLLMLVFGSGHSASKRNWAKAALIWMVISVVLSIAFFFVLGMLGYSLFAINQSASVG